MPPSDPKALIEEAMRLGAEATPGPWKAGRSDMTSYELEGGPFKNVYAADERGGVHHVTGETLPYVVARGEGDECHANATLIARARTLLPELADALEAALRKIEWLEGVINGFVDDALRDSDGE
jgi:hypothetical protein